MSCQEAFLKMLRERNFRLTPQREMVLSVMHEMTDFATAEEVHEHVQALSTAVDISTVYRTLDLLQELSLVASVDTGEGHRRYKLHGLHADHLHLVCRSCGQIVAADLEPALPLRAYMLEHYGFDVTLDGLNLPGLCQACTAGAA
jgi:Fur family ferric uptake transcriptional regulator